MTHNEHLRKADETYEVRHDNCGNAIHVYIKDGYAKIFGSMDDFINYIYGIDSSRYYIEVKEGMLDAIYETDAYTLNQVKNFIISRQMTDEFIYPICWEHDYRKFCATIDVRFESLSLMFSTDDQTYAFDIAINKSLMIVIVTSKQRNSEIQIELNGK
jgi:predicted RecB family endonuclease